MRYPLVAPFHLCMHSGGDASAGGKELTAAQKKRLKKKQKEKEGKVRVQEVSGVRFSERGTRSLAI